jgi:DNA-directed RNA polymerase specialized sigma24 family protein
LKSARCYPFTQLLLLAAPLLGGFAMATPSPFQELIDRWKSGDASALEEIWQQYGHHLQHVASRHLRHCHMQSYYDSEDICQSVLCNLLRSMPKADLQTPAQLFGYLAKAVQHKVQKKARRSIAQRRDIRRLLPGDIDDCETAAPNDAPLDVIAREESMTLDRTEMNDQEWSVWQLRIAGHSWTEIAERLSGDADALRIHFARLVGRIRRDLDDADRRCNGAERRLGPKPG